MVFLLFDYISSYIQREYEFLTSRQCSGGNSPYRALATPTEIARAAAMEIEKSPRKPAAVCNERISRHETSERKETVVIKYPKSETANISLRAQTQNGITRPLPPSPPSDEDGAVLNSLALERASNMQVN